VALASRPHLSEAAFLAAIVAAPWWLGGSPDPIRYGLASLCLGVTALWLLRRGELRSDVVIPAAALLAWGLLPAIVGFGSSRVSTLESALVLAGGLATLVYWAEQSREGASATRLAYATLIIATLQACFGVVQESVTPGRLYGEAMVFAKSPYGSYVTHNHFAGLMEMAIPLALGMALGRAKQQGGLGPFTVVGVGLALGLAGAHLASRSRGGLFALLIAGVAFVVFWRFARSRAHVSRFEAPLTVALVLAALAFAWLAVPSTTRAHLTTLFQGPTDGSGHDRVNIAAATWQLFGAHAFTGSTLGTYEDAVARFKRSHGLERLAHAESDAMELAAEGGLIALVLAAWLLWAVWRGAQNRLRESRDAWRKGMTVGAWAGVVALLAHSLVDFNLRGSPANAILFCALAGLTAAPRSEPRFLLPSIGTRVCAVILAVLAALAAWRAIGAIELWRAHRAASPDERLARLSTTLDHHPYLAPAYFERGQLRWWLARGVPDLVRFRVEGARSDLEKAVRLRAAWGDAWSDLGSVRQILGDTDGAKQAFDRAVELDPASARTGQARAEFFFATGNKEKGLEELRRIRRYNPQWSLDLARSLAARWGEGFK
jgi:tetratricopeptide (TPR) repeat protein